ncbi:hypothetical protein ACB092_08G098300 [Castanea dentata]
MPSQLGLGWLDVIQKTNQFSPINSFSSIRRRIGLGVALKLLSYALKHFRLSYFPQTRYYTLRKSKMGFSKF